MPTYDFNDITLKNNNEDNHSRSLSKFNNIQDEIGENKNYFT